MKSISPNKNTASSDIETTVNTTEEIKRAADSEDKEVSLCVMALTFVI
jgi:hypothetical protein